MPNIDLDEIERQLDKLDSTAGNLESLGYLATKDGDPETGRALAEQANELRVKQFLLYRQKEQIVIASNEWQALISSMDVVNHFVEDSMNDLKRVVEVVKAAAQLASIADGVLKAFAAVG